MRFFFSNCFLLLLFQQIFAFIPRYNKRQRHNHFLYASSGDDYTRREFDDNSNSTNVDWAGALARLQERIDDTDVTPSQALYRYMSAESPQSLIGNFIQTAKPSVVQAMSGTIGSLMGASSHEITVQTTGDKLAALCLQLQMTGYMFRNAEYVLALKELLKLDYNNYRQAFDELDVNNSGYIEVEEARKWLIREGYDQDAKKMPAYEVQAFVKFFDKNKDGKISWDEFKSVLGNVQSNNSRLLQYDYDDDDDDEDVLISDNIDGVVEVELENGKIIKVAAKEVVATLQQEANALRQALMQEKKQSSTTTTDIASYISSRQGNLQALTEGISPEIVETMQKLVNHVLDDGSGNSRNKVAKEEMQIELPGTSLQQLALWQLILGYRLREMEAKGEYLKLVDS